MSERIAHSIPFEITPEGEFITYHGEIIGKIINGRIENTKYKFKRGICGGIAITDHRRLEVIPDEDVLINPATGRRFDKTKKGTGYFSKIKDKVFLKTYQIDESCTNE